MEEIRLDRRGVAVGAEHPGMSSEVGGRACVLEAVSIKDLGLKLRIA